MQLLLIPGKSRRHQLQGKISTKEEIINLEDRDVLREINVRNKIGMNITTAALGVKKRVPTKILLGLACSSLALDQDSPPCAAIFLQFGFSSKNYVDFFTREWLGLGFRLCLAALPDTLTRENNKSKKNTNHGKKSATDLRPNG